MVLSFHTTNFESRIVIIGILRKITTAHDE